MLWVYGHYKTKYFFHSGDRFYTSESVDVRFWRIKTIPVLKGVRKKLWDILYFREEITYIYMYIRNLDIFAARAKSNIQM